MGFTTEFKNASTTATINAVTNELFAISTPGNNIEVISTAKVEIIILTKKFIIEISVKFSARKQQ